MSSPSPARRALRLARRLTPALLVAACQSSVEPARERPNQGPTLRASGEGGGLAPPRARFTDCIEPQFRPDGPPHTCDEECATRGAVCAEGACNGATIMVYGTRVTTPEDPCPERAPDVICGRAEPWRAACLPQDEQVTATIWACDRWLPASSDAPTDPPPYRDVRCCCDTN